MNGGMCRMTRWQRLALLLAWALVVPAAASARTVAELSELARAATFEVVLPKVEPDQVTYEKPLPLELLPFTERNDSFWSIGTAFAIAPDMFVSNAHVLMSGMGSALGHPHLRDAEGRVFKIDRILKFSLHEDFIVFRAGAARAAQALVPGAEPAVGAKVYAAGNALGEGVVVRDGLLTSLTPEDQDGRWKWLRFSAAASPGNSGGPLLDETGNVLGVVTARSQGENLNYALPIQRVLAASQAAGSIDMRASFGVPILRQQMVTELKVALPLPVSWDAFSRAMLEIDAREHAANQARLLDLHAAELPPGSGSQRLLAKLDRDRRFALISQQPDDSWGLTAPENTEDTELADGEYLQIGSFAGVYGFKWEYADEGNLPLPPPRDSRMFMDGLLKGLKLPRIIGPQAIRITSLGDPQGESLHTDRFGRIWQLRHWSLGYTDLQIVTLALPTPTGYVGLVQPATAAGHASVVSSLQLLADYLHASYSGSARQWQRFMVQQDLYPSLLRDVRFDAREDTQVRLTGLDVRIPATLLSLADHSQLNLYIGYASNDGRLLARPAGITLEERPGDEHSWVGVWAQPRPGEQAGTELQKRWHEMTARGTQYDGKPGHNPEHTAFWTVSALGDPDAGLQYEVTLSLREPSLLPREVSRRRDALHDGLTFRKENP